MPSHSHKYRLTFGATDPANGFAYGTQIAGIFENNMWIESSGGNQPHNNMSPYYTCYIFKRTN